MLIGLCEAVFAKSRRFYIESAGGNYVEVESERHIALPPAGHDLIIVYGNDGLG